MFEQQKAPDSMVTAEATSSCRTKRQELRKWQFRIFALSWLAYAAFYFPRSAFSAAKVGILDEGIISRQSLGLLDSAYLAAYALGQFVWGACAERWGTRVVVAGGMIMATVAAFFMGIGTALWLFLPLMIVQGLSQSTGWAALSKNIATFFTIKARGRAMGFFATSYAFGGLVGAPFTGWVAYSIFDSWRYAFISGATVMVFALVLFLIFQRNSPQEVGLPGIDEDPALLEADHVRVAQKPIRSTAARPRMQLGDLLAAARHDSMVLRLGIVYFLLKPARYAVLLWGPVLVIEAMPGIDVLTAVFVPISFGVAGVVAPVAFGWLSDTIFKGRRVPPSVISLAGLVVVLCLWQPVTATGSLLLIVVLLAAIGLAAYGADSMVSGVAAVDFGTSKYAAGAAGFINGCGSVGAILGGLLPGFFSGTTIFYTFAATAAVAAVILIPSWNRRPVSQ
ncbi:MFS transporter [Saxibacter everestensis]|uniref:MFS transporter n=1 Tax=Saxibacter everestensis TaxID=2909229 RepID=A0ABY8QRM7_9MICO|nr:MFS transporter [Brevibacteriaceae bacterium ZFBP1038]